MHNYYAVFGNPIKHSLSPLIHNEFAKQEQVPICYERILVASNNLKEYLDKFYHDNGLGANITVPFKLDAYKIANELSQNAIKAKAVNTLIRIENYNGWYGDNTDGVGLIKDLKRLKYNIKDSNILIIGAGGAAQGIINPIIEENPKNIYITNRTIQKAEKIAKIFDIGLCRNIMKIDYNFDLVINTTASSLNKKNLNIDNNIFNNLKLAYDLFYDKNDTAFMLQAKKGGTIDVKDGLGMLVYQAATSYELWRKFKPNVVPILQTIREII